MKSLPHEYQPNNGILSALDMDTVTFQQLNLRLQHPYVFLHRGCCEHSIVVNEIRLIHSSDNQSLSAYPICTYLAKTQRTLCRVCDLKNGAWVTFDDRLAPENPCVFCDVCFDLFHKDDEGNFIYEGFEYKPFIQM